MSLRAALQLATLWVIMVGIFTTIFIAKEHTLQGGEVDVPALKKAHESKETLYQHLYNAASSIRSELSLASTSSQEKSASIPHPSQQEPTLVRPISKTINNREQNPATKNSSILKSLLVVDENTGTDIKTHPKEPTTLAHYTLSITPNQLGTIISINPGINCGNTCTISLEEGTSISLIAYPSQGVTFSGWGGACSGIGICTILLKKNTVLSATFAQEKIITPQPVPQDQAPQQSSQYTLSQVSAHAAPTDCWIIVNNNVYSVASYISMHPGGRSAITSQCGKDATVSFTAKGGSGSHSSNAWSILGTFLIGTYTNVSPISGVCGSANTISFSAMPTSGLCSTGSATPVTGSGPWAWSCAGVSGGTTASCSAQKGVSTPVDGTCGNANNITAASSPTIGLCNSGSASSVSTLSSSYTWNCIGLNNGTTASCSAPVTQVIGLCGSSNGSNVSIAPSTNLCSAGSASQVTGSGPWAWSCSGSHGGGSASCGATLQSSSQFSLSQIGAHITSNDCWIIVNNNVYSVASYISMHPGGRSAITSQCGKDATVSFTAKGGSGSHSSNAWSILGTFLIGTVAQAPSTINGVCGTANGTSQSNAPSSNLCTNGSIASFSGTGPWTWSCTGSNGGTSVSCSTTQSQSPATPQTFIVNVTSTGTYDTTSLSLHTGDSITFVYTPPRGDEVKTTFSPAGISSITIDKDITQKTRTFNTQGTWTFKASEKNGNTGTIVVN